MPQTFTKPYSFKFRPRLSSFVIPSVNPFVHNEGLTKKQKVQIAIMTVTVVPLRLVMILVTFIFAWILGLFFTAGMIVPFKEPASQFRMKLFSILRKLLRVIFFFFGFHKIQVKGKQAAGKEAPILVVAPHSSMLDTFIMSLTDPVPSGVSRIENFQTPMLGTLSKAMQPVFVSRTDPQSRRKTILEIKQRVSEPGKWPQIIIFPEGTCTNRKALITFKAGAFIPGCAVQPVLIEYLNEWDSFTWTMTGLSTFKAVWWTLCQFSISAKVTYLPVYCPSKEEKSNAKLYANNVRNVMADALDLPITDHTFEDCRLMRRAASLNLPMESGLVEFAKISQKLGMDIDSVQDKLKDFSKIACEVDGIVSLESFAKYLNVPVSDAVKDMFHLYDRNDSGCIDFREYVIGLSLVSQPAATENTVKLAFQVFDKDRSGMITKKEFNQVLHAVFENEINGAEIFEKIKKADPDRISYEEFHDFVKKQPEYAKLFVWYKEMLPDSISDYEIDISSTQAQDKSLQNIIAATDITDFSEIKSEVSLNKNTEDFAKDKQSSEIRLRKADSSESH